MYITFIRPLLEYASDVLDWCILFEVKHLEKVQSPTTCFWVNKTFCRESGPVLQNLMVPLSIYIVGNSTKLTAI